MYYGTNDMFLQCFDSQYFLIASQARNDDVCRRHSEERSNPVKRNIMEKKDEDIRFESFTWDDNDPLTLYHHV